MIKILNIEAFTMFIDIHAHIHLHNQINRYTLYIFTYKYNQ